MALFNFGKKKEEEKKTPACACSCGCAASEAESITNDCCPDLKEGEICCIKVLGAGCKSCHEQFELVLCQDLAQVKMRNLSSS